MTILWVKIIERGAGPKYAGAQPRSALRRTSHVLFSLPDHSKITLLAVASSRHPLTRGQFNLACADIGQHRANPHSFRDSDESSEVNTAECALGVGRELSGWTWETHLVSIEWCYRPLSSPAWTRDGSGAHKPPRRAKDGI